VIKSRKMRLEKHAARIVEMRNAFATLVGKPEGKRSLERHRRTREDNIKMFLKKTGVRIRTGFNWLTTGISGSVL
jgi:hypothetical protein